MELFTDEEHQAWKAFSPLPATCPPSPFRTPAWRWHRAAWLVAVGRRCDQRLADGWVARARAFQSARTEPARGELDPDIAAALRLALEAPPEQRLRLDAYLLTAEPFGAVAACCSLEPATVEAYYALFFSVRPHLAARDWIMAQAVGGDLWHGLRAPGAVWKYAAYTAGVRALEVVLVVSTDLPLPSWLQKSFEPNAAGRRNQMKRKGLTPQGRERLGTSAPRTKRSDSSSEVFPDPLTPMGALQWGENASQRSSRNCPWTWTPMT